MAKAKGVDVNFARLIMALYSTLMKQNWIDSVFSMHPNIATSMIYFLQACMDETDSPEFVLPKILAMKTTTCLSTLSMWQNKDAKYKVKLSAAETISLLETSSAISSEKLNEVLKSCQSIDEVKKKIITFLRTKTGVDLGEKMDAAVDKLVSKHDEIFQAIYLEIYTQADAIAQKHPDQFYSNPYQIY